MAAIPHVIRVSPPDFADEVALLIKRKLGLRMSGIASAGLDGVHLTEFVVPMTKVVTGVLTAALALWLARRQGRGVELSIDGTEIRASAPLNPTPKAARFKKKAPLRRKSKALPHGSQKTAKKGTAKSPTRRSTSAVKKGTAKSPIRRSKS